MIHEAMRPGRTERPPAWALPVTVPGDLELLSQPGTVVGVGPICAYPVGFTFYLIASLDTSLASPSELLFLGRTAHERENMTRLLIRYSDGTAASSAVTKHTAGGEQLTLRYCGEVREASGNWSRLESTWWVSPLPPPGPVEFQIQLPTAKQTSGTAHCDGSSIIQAASRSEILWPGGHHL